MAIDSNIPLSYTPSNNLGAILQNVNSLQQLKQQQQAQQAQNALAQVFQHPSNLAPDGTLKPEAMGRVYQISPALGMKFSQQQAAMAEKRAQEAHLNSETAVNQRKLVGDAAGEAAQTYEASLAAGKSPDQATLDMQNAWSESVKQLKASGTFSETAAALLPQAADYKRLKSMALSLKDMMAAKEKEKSDARADARLGLAEGMLGLAEQREARAEAKDAKTADGKLDPDTIKEMAGQYLAGDKSVFTNLGRGAQSSANIAAVRQEIQRQAKEAKMSPADVATKIAEFSGLTAGERSLGTRSAQMGMAVDEASRIMPLAREASANVARTQFVPVNRAIQAVESGSSDPNLARFVAANQSLINVYARAMSPTGVPTVTDKEHARDMLSTAQNDTSYNAVLDQMQAEMDAARKAPGDVKVELSGKGEKPASDGWSIKAVQ